MLSEEMLNTMLMNKMESESHKEKMKKLIEWDFVKHDVNESEKPNLMNTIFDFYKESNSLKLITLFYDKRIASLKEIFVDDKESPDVVVFFSRESAWDDFYIHIENSNFESFTNYLLNTIRKVKDLKEIVMPIDESLKIKEDDSLHMLSTLFKVLNHETIYTNIVSNIRKIKFIDESILELEYVWLKYNPNRFRTDPINDSKFLIVKKMDPTNGSLNIANKLILMLSRKKFKDPSQHELRSIFFNT